MNLYAGSSTGESAAFSAGSHEQIDGFGNDEPVVMEGANSAGERPAERPIETRKVGGSNPPPRAKILR